MADTSHSGLCAVLQIILIWIILDSITQKCCSEIYRFIGSGDTLECSLLLFRIRTCMSSFAHLGSRGGGRVMLCPANYVQQMVKVYYSTPPPESAMALRFIVGVIHIGINAYACVLYGL